MYAAIENIFVQSKPTKSGALKLAVIGSFLFAYQLKQDDILRIFCSHQYSLKSVYLLHANYFEMPDLLGIVCEFVSIHFLNTSLSSMALSVCIDIFAITSLFIYDDTLTEQEAHPIYSLI